MLARRGGLRPTLDPARWGIAALTVGQHGENQFDDVIRNSASFQKDGIPLPGRSAPVFLEARF